MSMLKKCFWQVFSKIQNPGIFRYALSDMTNGSYRLKRGQIYVNAMAAWYYDDKEHESELVDFEDYMDKVSQGPINQEFRYIGKCSACTVHK